jgi:hypothetical protein
MTQRFSLTSMAATLLLAALSGCAYLHKETPQPVPKLALAPAEPAPAFAPLYTQMSESDPSLPDLPSPPAPGAQPTPPPASVIVDTTRKPARNGRRHGRKGELEVAERESHERENHDKENSSTDTASSPAEGQNVKVTAPTPSGDTSAPTAIGQLTAGPTQDTTGSRQQAASLIATTRHGVDSLHNLNGDQEKTVVQIRSFLDQAQRALQKDDVDGAHTLATKAKTLLDELTGAA